MAIKTQRTSLYYIDPDDGEIVTVGCATSIDGLNSPRDQNETTCLEDEDKQFEAGTKTPGTMTVALKFDSADESHVKLDALWDSGDKVMWAIGWGNGPPAPAALVPPTLNSAGEFEFPDTRTYTMQEGYVQDLGLSFPLNGVVEGSVVVQMSGKRYLMPRTAT